MAYLDSTCLNCIEYLQGWNYLSPRKSPYGEFSVGELGYSFCENFGSTKNGVQ